MHFCLSRHYIKDLYPEFRSDPLIRLRAFVSFSDLETDEYPVSRVEAVAVPPETKPMNLGANHFTIVRYVP